MIKIRTNYKVKLALLGLCGALSGRLYGGQANDASAGQKEKAAHYQGLKSPKRPIKRVQPSKANKMLFANFSKYPRSK